MQIGTQVCLHSLAYLLSICVHNMFLEWSRMQCVLGCVLLRFKRHLQRQMAMGLPCISFSWNQQQTNIYNILRKCVALYGTPIRQDSMIPWPNVMANKQWEGYFPLKIVLHPSQGPPNTGATSCPNVDIICSIAMMVKRSPASGK